MKMSAPQLLAEMLESLTRQIKAKGRQDQYCSITIQPGNSVAYDFGDNNCMGMAWVRLVTSNPTVAFPTPNVTADGCLTGNLALTVELGMLAPAPHVDARLGEFIVPEDTELFDASMRQVEEMQMMFDAIRTAQIPELQLGTYAPEGPDGGVVGGTWTAIIGGDD